ncbi:helicase associated domain-containing protein [Arthrobacter mobilis]|uniref:Uncharacterized protein n=1 Tax=Arthrobacter mobilis TaxID=2724944 RepID=A0A7X6HF85_9MICC|nr:helicase associated domain-containing protein [Arthrobacter mobilis]NKX55991.1 hypothetical protein [Arthrobacter mobilis]
MGTLTQNRVQRGVREGGQFSHTTHQESPGLKLSAPQAGLDPEVEERIQVLEEFVNTHGYRPGATNERTMHGRLARLRTMLEKGELPADAAARVKNLLDAPNLTEYEFTTAFTRLKDTCQRLSRLPTPKEDAEMAKWVYRWRDRAMNGRADAAKVKLLAATPGMLEPVSREVKAERMRKLNTQTPEQWQARYDEFAARVKENGRLPMRNDPDKQEMRQYDFLFNQRKLLREDKLPDERRELLARHPGALETYSMNSPTARLEQLAAFHRTHGCRRWAPRTRPRRPWATTW